jgi:zinc protease
MRHAFRARAVVVIACAGAFAGVAAPASAQQRTRPESLDRSKRPSASPARDFKLPKAEQRTLANGLEVYVIEHRELPVVAVRASLDIGPVLDPPGKEGLSALVSAMLSEGTTSMTADQVAEAFADLGNSVTPSGFAAVTRNVERSLELLADMLANPSFPQEALDRQKQNTSAALERANESPQTVAGRIFNSVVHGADHPYARTATARTVASITRDDVVRFHARYVRARNTKLLVVGDVTADGVVPMIERAFATLQPGGTAASYEVSPPRVHGPTRIYLYDRPGSPQSVVRVGHIGPRRDSQDHFALEILNTVFGGLSGSRLNRNLRQTNSFTYGAFSRFQWRRGPEPSTFISQADISASKTDSALVEWMRELRAIRGDRPITRAELDFAKTNRVAGLPARLEAASDLAAMLGNLLANSVPLDYYERYIAAVAKLTEADLAPLARRHIDPDNSAIVIVGDRKLIEPGLRVANIAPIVLVDENGNVVP